MEIGFRHVLLVSIALLLPGEISTYGRYPHHRQFHESVTYHPAPGHHTGHHAGHHAGHGHHQNHTIQYGDIENLLEPLTPEFRLLMAGGATNPYIRSLSAFQLPVLSMWENATLDVLSDIKDGLRHILQTNNEYTMALHGTGSTGMSACLDNLVEPGDKVVVGVNGFWENIVAEMAERYGAQVIRLERPDGERFTLAEVEAAVRKHRPKIVFLANGESATGVYQPVDGVGELCHKFGCITIIDVVSTVGSQPIKMDERKIDVVYMNTQKAIGGIVGLAPVSFSPRAIQMIKNRRILPRMRQNDIILNAINPWDIEKTPNGEQSYPVHSLSMPLLYMLREALSQLVEEGLEHVYRRHAEINKIFQAKAVNQLGLEFFVEKEEDRLIGTTTFKVPRGKDPVKITRFMLEKYGIEISAGVGNSFRKVLRVGMFGSRATRLVVDEVIQALHAALSSPLTNI